MVQYLGVTAIFVVSAVERQVIVFERWHQILNSTTVH